MANEYDIGLTGENAKAGIVNAFNWLGEKGGTTAWTFPNINAIGKLEVSQWRAPLAGDSTSLLKIDSNATIGVSKILAPIDHIHPTIIDDSSTTDTYRTWSANKLHTGFDEKADTTGGTGDTIDYTGVGCDITVKDTPIAGASAVNKNYVDDKSTMLGACWFFNASGVTLTITSTYKSINYNDSVVTDGITVNGIFDDKTIAIPKTGKYRVSFDATYLPSAAETITAQVMKGASANTPIAGFSSRSVVPDPIVERSVAMTRIVSLVAGDRVMLALKTNTNPIIITHYAGSLSVDWVGV